MFFDDTSKVHRALRVVRVLEREVVITTGIDLPIFDQVVQVVLAFAVVAFLSRATSITRRVTLESKIPREQCRINNWGGGVWCKLLRGGVPSERRRRRSRRFEVADVALSQIKKW